jgi:hypothetical protein
VVGSGLPSGGTRLGKTDEIGRGVIFFLHFFFSILQKLYLYDPKKVEEKVYFTPTYEGWNTSPSDL